MKGDPMMKDGSYHYSGDHSKQFWLRVKMLPKEPSNRIYVLGVVLQNLEEAVLRELRNEESLANKERKVKGK